MVLDKDTSRHIHLLISSLIAHIEIERASDNLLRTGKGAGAMQGRRESSTMAGGAFAHQHPGYGK